MHWIVSTATVGLLSSLAFAAAPPDDATVTLKRLIEKRELSPVKTPFSGWESGIDLQLHVDGPGVKDARKFGKLKITEASDDAGTDLTKKPKGTPSYDNEEFREIQPPHSFGFDDKAPKPTGFDVEIKLSTPSARAAKSIKVIRGEIQVLVGGEKKVVEVKNFKSVYGKVLADPSLKAVGVNFTLLDPAKPSNERATFGARENDGKSVPVMMSGNLDAVSEVRFVNKAGEQINQGWMGQNDPTSKHRTLTYDLSEPLSDDVTLQIEVWPGQKTLTVPFELENVKLP
jgi:hypothetical protein